MKWSEDNSVLTDAQFGFRPGYDTHDAISALHSIISKSLIKVITKLPNSEQSYKGKVKTHNYINRQNQSTTGKL